MNLRTVIVGVDIVVHTTDDKVTVHPLGLPSSGIAGIEIEQARLVGGVQLFRHLEGKLKFTVAHRVAPGVEQIVSRIEGIGNNLAVVVAITPGNHLTLGVVQARINQSVEIGDAGIRSRLNLALDRYPRTGFESQAVGLDLRKQGIVDGRYRHLVRGSVEA